MKYTDRFRRVSRQWTYQRDIRARGLAAILEPYTIRTPRLPRQRTNASDPFQKVGVSG